MHRLLSYRSFQFLIFVLLTVLLFQYYSYQSTAGEHFNNCWSGPENCDEKIISKYAKKMHLKEVEIPTKNSIMMVEGHGNNYLTPRMWCTVESASYRNPESQIFVILTSPFLYETPAMIAASQNSNINFVHLNIEKLFEGSPLLDWYNTKRWEESRWPKSHFTDGLRWMLLWKYGGIYLDLDVIVTRSLSNIGNFTGLESSKFVGAGVLGFDVPRHSLVTACLEKMASNFDGNVWGANGPELLTQILQQKCGMETESVLCPDCPKMPDSGEPQVYPMCPDMKIFPTKSFYNIPWWRWHEFIDENKDAQKILSDEKIYALHVWNFFAQKHPVAIDSNSLYSFAVQENCPNVARIVGTVF